VRGGDGSAALRLRRFGTCLADLQIDLDAWDVAGSTTDLLAACSVPPRDAEFYQDLPIGTRTAGLLILASLDGADAIEVELRCDGCGLSLEVSLTIDELLEREQCALDAVTLASGDGTTVELRRPTGRDQSLWASELYENEEAARRAIAARLAGRGDVLDTDSIGRIEDVLERADPLIRTAIETSCPDCGRRAEHDVDVAGAVLVRLRRAQHALIEIVHALASRYHWSEADIVAMPAWRRSRYAALLSRESS
jgi:hypothetical protein